MSHFISTCVSISKEEMYRHSTSEKIDFEIVNEHVSVTQSFEKLVVLPSSARSCNMFIRYHIL